jgi:transcriptional regulator with XRE-family HTH domain
MKADNDIFRLRVKEILKERRQTQKDLAAKMGKSPQYIANVLNSEQGVSVNVLIELAKVLDVEFRDLFAVTRTEDKDALAIVCPHCGKPITIKVEQP